MRTIRIGTRGSQLALWQANYIEGLLRESHPAVQLEQIIIKTEGDRDQSSSLTQIGGTGVFTKAIEDALLENRVDIAVHSLKDLPSTMTAGLALGAVPQRGPVEDVLVTTDGRSYKELKENARVASGSIRRRSQLLRLRPDLEMEDLRGNIDTRLRKLREQNLDGIIMARAALFRLELNEVAYNTFKSDEMIPGVGQGAVGIQIRTDDEEVRALVKTVNDLNTYNAVTAERAFLRELDSGCQFPVGGYATHVDGQLLLKGFVGSEDGNNVLIDQDQGAPQDAEQLGSRLAQSFIDRGAQDILERVNNG